MIVSRIAPALRANEHGIADLALTPDGNLDMVIDAEAVGQHARQRLMTFEEEWFLDTTAGVVWLQEIMGRPENLPLAEGVIKAEILDTDGVTGISSFAIRFDRVTRKLEVSRATVRTEYDEDASV